MDNALQMINDLNRLHGIKISATKKDNKFAAVNELRDLLASGRIKIHPRCKHLIYHLEHVKWKDKKGIKAEFDHLADSTDKTILGGHADAADAILYLSRNVKFNKNPKTTEIVYDLENQYIHIRNKAVDVKKQMMQKLTGNRKR